MGFFVAEKGAGFGEFIKIFRFGHNLVMYLGPEASQNSSKTAYAGPVCTLPAWSVSACTLPAHAVPAWAVLAYTSSARASPAHPVPTWALHVCALPARALP